MNDKQFHPLPRLFVDLLIPGLIIGRRTKKEEETI